MLLNFPPALQNDAIAKIGINKLHKYKGKFSGVYPLVKAVICLKDSSESMAIVISKNGILLTAADLFPILLYKTYAQKRMIIKKLKTNLLYPSITKITILKLSKYS